MEKNRGGAETAKEEKVEISVTVNGSRRNQGAG